MYLIYKDDSNGWQIKISDTVEIGWTNLSSIENWYKYIDDLDRDYKFVRNEIKLLANEKVLDDYATNWDLLNQAEKEIVSKLIIAPKEQRLLIYTYDDLEKIYSPIHDTKSCKAREARLYTLQMMIYNRFDIISQNILMGDLLGNGLIDMYVNYGREGITEDGIYGFLFDYIEGRGDTGQTFAADGTCPGFPYKTWTIDGYTTSEFQVKAMDILKNGNY